MGWSKRGNGKSYNSLNGYGSIIGFLSGKILDYGVRNRKCKFCDKGHPPEDHDCRQNHNGSAKSMEASVGIELVNRSEILKKAGLRVRVLVGEEDSSTIAAVRTGSEAHIYKFADTNHLYKHFNESLIKMKQKFKEIRAASTIPHIKRCFGYAVKTCNGDAIALANTLRNLPEHFFNHHENCGDWCRTGADNGSKPHTLNLQNNELYLELKELFNKFANNAPKFAVAASSQANESFNNIVAHKAHKNHCYSLSESCSYRVASAVATKNEGDSHLVGVNQILSVSPGKHTASYMAKNDERRKRRAAKAKLPATKKRRNFLAKSKEVTRQNKEKQEGLQYQSNCGLLIDVDSANVMINTKTLYSKLRDIHIRSEDCSLVYFDLETSGFSSTADILQIAAKFGNRTFDVYIKPTQPIDHQAFKVTGLENIKGNLYLYGKPVKSITVKEALISLLQFLNFSSKPCILVAYNARFDSSHLLRAIINSSMIEEFQKIAGFSDTMSLLKKCFPDRKGPHLFKLEKLAQDFLQVQPTGKFHEAIYDVEILEILSNTFLKKVDLMENCVLYKASVMQRIIVPSLEPLKGVISDMMIKRIASECITFDNLKNTYEELGSTGIKQLLSDKYDSCKPRITKDSRILKKITDYFNNK